MPTPDLAALGADRIGPLLVPLAGLGPGLSVTVEDAAGRTVARIGAADEGRGGSPGSDLTVPIEADGQPAGRVVAHGPIDERDRPAVEAALGVLAAALSALSESPDPADLVRRTRIEAELTLGRRLQRSFVPLDGPAVPGWDLACRFEPAREVGGDFFDVFRPRGRPGELSLVIADVTGKGIAAALLMAFARPLIHAAIDHVRRPAVALERTNRILVEERRAALFITAQVIRLQISTGRFSLANAGHEPPLIARADGRPLEEVDAPGVLLGAFKQLDLGERAGALDRGDLLLLYTDGVTDARAPNGERFGDTRLRSIVEAGRGATARELTDAIVDAVTEFSAGQPAEDDVTLVALRRLTAD